MGSNNSGIIVSKYYYSLSKRQNNYKYSLARFSQARLYIILISATARIYLVIANMKHLLITRLYRYR